MSDHHGSGHHAKFGVIRRSASFAGALAFVIAFASMQAKTWSTYISPWDEMYHLSYIEYVYDGHIPRSGDSLNVWSREGFSCKPVYPFGITTAVPCGEVAEPATYPEGGTNTASGWPPGYYTIVAIGLRVLLPFSDHPIAFARLMTAAIWALGVGLIAYVNRRRGSSLTSILGISAVISSLPFAFFHGAFITPHSTAPMLVGLALAIDLRRDSQLWSARRSALVLTAFSLMASLTLPHFAPVVLIVAISWIASNPNVATHNQAEGRKQFLLLVAPVIAFMMYRLWSAFQEFRSVSFGSTTNADAGQVAIEVPWNRYSIMEAIWRFFPHSIDKYQHLGPIELFLSASWSYALLAGIGALALGKIEDRRVRFMAFGVIFVGIIQSLYMQKVAVAPVPARYGISIVLFGFAILPKVFDSSRASKVTLALLAAVTYLVCFPIMPFTLT